MCQEAGRGSACVGLRRRCVHHKVRGLHRPAIAHVDDLEAGVWHTPPKECMPAASRPSQPGSVRSIGYYDPVGHQKRQDDRLNRNHSEYDANDLLETPSLAFHGYPHYTNREGIEPPAGCIPLLYGNSTTYFVADAPAPIASKPFWISSNPRPTTFGSGLPFNNPFSNADVNQPCHIAGPTSLSANHAPQSAFKSARKPQISRGQVRTTHYKQSPPSPAAPPQTS